VRKILLCTLAALAMAAFLRQRRHPIPHPPRLTFLFENPLVGAFVGSGRLIERLNVAPGMRVLDAGCGPGRLTIPLARAVGPAGEVVALDGQPEMLEKLGRRLEGEGITNVRPLRAGLGEGTLRGGGFDRAVLAMVLGEVRDRGEAVHELYAALEPGGVLSVTEIFGDPDYRRPSTVRREVESAGFRLVRRFGGFPAFTLNFERPVSYGGRGSSLCGALQGFCLKAVAESAPGHRSNGSSS
jgi:SAM-dependent methyltransferase